MIYTFLLFSVYAKHRQTTSLSQGVILSFSFQSNLYLGKHEGGGFFLDDVCVFVQVCNLAHLNVNRGRLATDGESSSPWC